ncbi:hypothetical protein BH10ACT1_BH10ACT1_13650 [soil metagenome]
MHHHRGLRAALIALFLSSVAVGCGASGGDDPSVAAPKATTTAAPTTEAPAADAGPAATTTTEMEGKGDDIPEDEPASGPTEQFTTVHDPVHDAFSVGVPEGWASLVYSSVEGQVTHEVVNTVSPDGKTILFIGDPKIPSYWNPATANPVTVSFTEKLDFMELKSYVPAPEYMPAYVEQKFSKLPGFEISETIEDPAAEANLTQAFVDRGITPPNVHVADVHFGYQDEEGEQINALVVGTTMDSGDFWQASVLGLSTTASTDEYRPMLAAMTHTQQSNPAWTAQQDARHQQVLADIDRRTAEMTSQHEANMAAIQSSAQRHQQKMEGLWAANDASVANFYDRMDAGDATQRGFLNYINDENTVASTSGQQFQVDDSYDRYWLNPATGAYAGGDINFGDTQLRELGLNPSDYEEVQVIR